MYFATVSRWKVFEYVRPTFPNICLSFFVAAYPMESPCLSDPIIDPGSFHFRCDINFDPTRRDTGFEVIWMFDGHVVPTVPPVTLTDGIARWVDLDQRSLKGHLGKDVGVYHLRSKLSAHNTVGLKMHSRCSVGTKLSWHSIVSDSGG